MGSGLQRVAHRNEPLRVGRQAGFPRPRRGACRRHPQDFVQLEAGPAAAFDSAVGRTVDRAVGPYFHSAASEQFAERGAHAPIVGGQDVGPVGDEHVRQMVGRTVLFCQESAQAILHGQQEFDTTRAAADHADVRGLRARQTASA